MPARPISPIQQTPLASYELYFPKQCKKRPLACDDCDSSVASKFVKFAEDSKVCEIIPVESITPEEKDVRWYDNAFYQDNKTMIADTIFLMTTTMCLDEENEDEFCMRGLESKTPEGRRRRSLNKADAISAVLAEQDRQLMEDEHDPETLADIYFQFTSHCRESAYAMGLQDEKEVLSQCFVRH